AGATASRGRAIVFDTLLTAALARSRTSTPQRPTALGQNLSLARSIAPQKWIATDQGDFICSMSDDPIAKFKEAQRQGWKHFAPLEGLTTPAAARLVKWANIRAGQNVLDVGCGTGVVSITAARLGARVFA